MGKKHVERRQLSAEEKNRNAEHRMNRLAYKYAVELAEADDEIKRRIVAQVYGFKLQDPDEKSKQELTSYLLEITKQRIREDPDLQHKITDAVIQKLMEEYGYIADGEEWRKKPSTMDDLIQQFEKVNELKEVLGIKEPGLLDAITHPDVIKAIVQLLMKATGSKQPQATNEGFIDLKIDGKKTQMTWEQFADFIGNRKVKPLENLELTEPNNPNKKNELTSESKTTDKTDEKDGETDADSSGN